MDYTINKSDNLWNIVKTQYNDSVKTNADIQKTVNKIAKINKLDDPNLIYAGNTLSLPSYDSIFEVQEEDMAETGAQSADGLTDGEEDAVSTSLYDDFSNWIKDGYQKLTGGKKDEIEMFDYVQSDVSPDDEAFIEPFKEGALNLAQANLDSADIDSDGVMSYQEFVKQEVEQYNELFPSDTYQFDEETGNIQASSLNPETGEYEADDYMNTFMTENFDALDLDKSGTLDKNELASYYAALDASDSSEGYVDGKIQLGVMTNVDLTGDDFQKRLNGAAKIFINSEE